MKKIFTAAMMFCMAAAVAGCAEEQRPVSDIVYIQLSDRRITVDGQNLSEGSAGGVSLSNDIVYYRDGQGRAYGEGSDEEAHSRQEADPHQVITITQPGNYTVSGSLSRGQIAIDLGRDSARDSSAVVNLTLDNVDLTCTVAPAIICYNAYECGNYDTSSASMDVDTSAAGFNLILARDSDNNINGSHVAKIYKEETQGKLHKYDAAIESLVSFNVSGDGVLNLTADNEGMESSLHMTINGGTLNITSGDDALNAGEDGVSVITVNDGRVMACSRLGDEGDGIDSNGWIVINGGHIIASANANSMDGGLDSDNGIYINGGTVLATGNMYDEVSGDSAQNFMVLNLDRKIRAGDTVMLKSSDDVPVVAMSAVQGYTIMVYSSPLLAEDDYTVYKVEEITGESINGIYANITDYSGRQQLAYSESPSAGGFGGGRPSNGEMPEGEMPQGPQAPDGEPVEDGRQPPDKPAQNTPADAADNRQNTVFSLDSDANFFMSIKAYT